MIVAFVALAAAMDLLDRTRPPVLAPLRALLVARIFATPQGTQGLLATIATGIITITSITISLLLIALQQAAGALTARVFDQYLRRWYNQAFFGYFVGLAVYTLLILATVNPPFNPVFGGTLDLGLMFAALALLIVLLYSTINQTRPDVITEAVHDLVLVARRRQQPLLRATLRRPAHSGPVSATVRAERDGFITQIDVRTIGMAARAHRSEIALAVSIGSYVAYGDVIAYVSAATDADADAIAPLVRKGVHVERQRDVRIDCAFGIAQLETIGWTSVSSAKQNPSAGLLAVQNLRDILARWSKLGEGADQRDGATYPVVYHDNALERLMDAFESLAVASSESLQHMVFSATVHALAHTFDRLATDVQDRVEALVLRMLPVLGDHAPTRELDVALHDLAKVLRVEHRDATASAVEAAQARFDLAVVKLRSRSTRLPHESQ